MSRSGEEQRAVMSRSGEEQRAVMSRSGEEQRAVMSRSGEEQRAVTDLTRQRRSLSFGEEAAAYERGRPSYPPDAIDWLLPRQARDVLDLGAGTGKLTTRLVERGLSVVAVDPIP